MITLISCKSVNIHVIVLCRDINFSVKLELNEYSNRIPKLFNGQDAPENLKPFEFKVLKRLPKTKTLSFRKQIKVILL